MHLFAVLGVIGVSSAGAQGPEQNFLLRGLSRAIAPIDYSIGALVAIDPATRRVLESGLSYLYEGDMDAFVRLVAPESRHRLRERLQDFVEAIADQRVPIDSIRIAPLQEHSGMGRVNTTTGESGQGYALRLIQGEHAVSGEVWVVAGNAGPIIDDLVLDFGNRESFGDDSRKFAPGSARTVW